jgi:hypothetical protein
MDFEEKLFARDGFSTVSDIFWRMVPLKISSRKSHLLKGSNHAP